MSIEHMVLRTYSKFTDAQEARNALLAAGFAPEAISLTAKEDEAGPVAGNFMIDREQHSDNKRHTPDRQRGYDPNEVPDTRPADWGSSYMLMIDAQDNDQLSVATEIAERFGGLDVEQVIAGQSAGAASGDRVHGKRDS